MTKPVLLRREDRAPGYEPCLDLTRDRLRPNMSDAVFATIWILVQGRTRVRVQDRFSTCVRRRIQKLMQYDHSP